MRDRPDKVMLFAAGSGTRMGALTAKIAKPMIEVAGRPLIDHALALIRDAGIRHIVANTFYKPDALEAHLRDVGVEITRETALLDTGGGLRNAMSLLGDGPVITLNSDAVWAGSNAIVAVQTAWQPDRMDALVVLIAADKAAGHPGAGDFAMDAEGRLRRGTDYIYTGLQILNPERLTEIAEPVFSLNKVWDLIAAEGRLFGLVHNGGWCDVGQPSSIPLAEAMLNV